MTLREDLLQSPAFTLDDNLFFHKSDRRNQDFEKDYIAVRERESRIYPDEVVRQLPEISSSHPLYQEWAIRKKSFQKLFAYLERSVGNKKILEVGCGNGWLSHQLSKQKRNDVIGLDLNEIELRQAASVFGDRSNLSFIYADIFTLTLLSKFDFIVLASSVQYFRDFQILILKLFDLLTEEGEIHIIDSPFYKTSELPVARARSESYFQRFKLNIAPFYFHHPWDSLDGFHSKVLYNPRALLTRLKARVVKNESPFPWIRIKK